MVNFGKMEVELEFEVNTVQVVQAAKEVEGKLGGLQKTVSKLSSGISSLFSSMDIGAFFADAVASCESLEGTLFTLRMNFGKLKAAIGNMAAPILQVVIPVVNQALAALARLAHGVGQVMGALFGVSFGGESAENMESLAAATSSAGKAAKKALASFDEIERLSFSGGSGGSGGSVEVSGITTGTVTDTLSPQLQAIVDKIRSLLAPLKKIDLTAAAQAFDRLKSALAPITRELFAGLEWAWHNILVPLAKWTVEDALPVFLDMLSGALSLLSSVITALQPLAQWLWDNFLQPIAQWTGGAIVAVLDLLTQGMSELSDWIENNQGLVQGFITVLGSFATAWITVNGAMSAWNAISDAWTNRATFAESVTKMFGGALDFLKSPTGIAIAAIGSLIAIIALLIQNWDAISAKTQEVWSFVQTKFAEFDAYLQNIFLKDWSEQFGAFGHILNGFLANVKNVWNAIKTVFSGIVTFITGVFSGDWSRAWSGIVEIFSGIWEGISAFLKTPINGVIGMINGLISGIISGINSMIRALNKVSFTVPEWVPEIGGMTMGLNLKTLSTPQIPYLAKGAVLPANKPFLAVVGDQRHGTNIEAPLETIQQAVAAVLGSSNTALAGRMDESVRVQQQILRAVLGIEIGDTTIGRAAARYNEKMAVMGGPYA